MRKKTVMKTVAAACLMMAAVTQTVQAETGDGHFWLKLQEKNIGMDDAARHLGEWINVPEGTTFELIGDETDDLGIRHIRYRQYVDGYEVQSSMVILHGRNGVVTSANGVVMEQSAQPKVRRRAVARTGGNASMDDTDKMYLVETADGYRYAKCRYDPVLRADVYTDAETGEIVKALSLRHNLTETIQGRSLYSGTVPLTVGVQADGTYLTVDETRNIFTLDAHNAKSVDKEDYICGTTTDGKELYDRERYIKEQCSPFTIKDKLLTMTQLVEYTLDGISKQDDQFEELYMVVRNKKGEAMDKTKRFYASDLPVTIKPNVAGGPSAFCNFDDFGIEVWKYNYTGDDTRLDSIGMGTLAVGKHDWKTDVTTGHTLTVATGDPVADIHWGMQQTYDWYVNTVGRKSYDDKGGPIYNIIYASEHTPFIEMPYLDNAMAEFDPQYNCYVMEYGIGDGDEMSPVVAVDVLAHEFTHLVTHCTSDLEGRDFTSDYVTESAALNESFSDIMAICVKKTAKGSKAADNWMIGDEMMLKIPCVRDLSHKVESARVSPIYYRGKDWVDGADEHANCAVQNYWFYLLCEGSDGAGQGDKPVVDPIGIDKAVQVAYRSLTKYLTPKTNYVDARKGSLLAAADLYGEDSEYWDVEDAWDAVGVKEDTTPPTAIRNVSNDVKTAESKDWYNLQGQRIEKPSKEGVYIVNGKKVVVE